MSQASVILGRDGLGSDADEAFFDAWTAYVDENIDEATGFTVQVGQKTERDIQNDTIKAEPEQAEVIKEALTSLWEGFCARG